MFYSDQSPCCISGTVGSPHGTGADLPCPHPAVGQQLACTRAAAAGTHQPVSRVVPAGQQELLQQQQQQQREMAGLDGCKIIRITGTSALLYASGRVS